ncbi:hypothetical protein [Brevibacterium daeguense]
MSSRPTAFGSGSRRLTAPAIFDSFVSPNCQRRADDTSVRPAHL